MAMLLFTKAWDQDSCVRIETKFAAINSILRYPLASGIFFGSSRWPVFLFLTSYYRPFRSTLFALCLILKEGQKPVLCCCRRIGEIKIVLCQLVGVRNTIPGKLESLLVFFKAKPGLCCSSPRWGQGFRNRLEPAHFCCCQVRSQHLTYCWVLCGFWACRV